ncbi:cytidine deaminase [Gaoshiqia sp. Z1-71]|uniref:cytidine deaminase n=1 Tax=Gaoshiqia hydrogeniformans TaxID=3290090 RepID=UPI003BF8045E
MKTKEIKILIHQYSRLEELITNDRELILAAREIAKKAYAPYSGFKVGAALRMEDGSIIAGNNQENASSPIGTCAERSALFWANSNFPEKAVAAIAVTAIDQNGQRAKSLSPCGACRQAMLETQSRFAKPIRILLESRELIEELTNVESLLPLSFNGNSLKAGV